MTIDHRNHFDRRRALLAFGLAGAAGLGAPLRALGNETYPNKTVRIICAFPPGNSSDLASRILSDQLQRRWKQAVVVENRPGASGIIAATAIQNAPPDGYSLLMTSTSFVINGSVMKSATYDIDKDFTAISLINSIPVVLLVRKDFPANTLTEFVDLVRQNPGKYSYAHPGVGTVQNMTMKLFMSKTGTRLNEIAYKGSVQAMTDIVGGFTDVMFEASNSAFTFVESGRVKALACSGPAPYFALPKVPTMKQSGVDVNVVGFTVIMAPGSTPRDVVDYVNGEIKTVLGTPEVIAAMQHAGFEVYPQMGAAEVGQWLLRESSRWEQVARAANIAKE
jgi:tripartite-type tricarboxylate transporter receptor subunit TctC